MALAIYLCGMSLCSSKSIVLHSFSHHLGSPELKIYLHITWRSILDLQTINPSTMLWTHKGLGANLLPTSFHITAYNNDIENKGFNTKWLALLQKLSPVIHKPRQVLEHYTIIKPSHCCTFSSAFFPPAYHPQGHLTDQDGCWRANYHITFQDFRDPQRAPLLISGRLCRSTTWHFYMYPTCSSKSQRGCETVRILDSMCLTRNQDVRKEGGGWMFCRHLASLLQPYIVYTHSVKMNDQCLGQWKKGRFSNMVPFNTSANLSDDSVWSVLHASSTC